MSVHPQDIDFAQVLKQSFDSDAQALQVSALNQLIPQRFDTIQLAYTGSNVTEVTYKANGVTVAVLTLTYSGSNLIQVSRS